MSEPRRSLMVGELQLLWWLLAILLAVAFTNPPPGPRWIAFLGGVWAIGFIPLLGTRGDRVADAIGAALGRPLFRAMLLVLFALLVLVTLLLSVAAALMVLLLGAALVFLLAAWRGHPAVERLVVSAGIVGSLVALVFGGLEMLLRREPFATRLGVPTELAKWGGRYDRLWDHNVFRLRSPYEQVARVPGTLRVIALGDSFTFGDRVAKADDVWPARLERALSERWSPGQRIEVINMGRPGFTTANEAELLRRLGWQFQPDLVVVQFLVNDAQPSNVNFRMRVPQERVLVIPPRFMTGAIRSSAVWSVMLKGIRGIVERGPRYQIYQEDFREGTRGWTQLQAAVREMGEASRAHGTPILLALFPMLTPGEWTEATYPFADVHRRVARVAQAAGLDVFDLTGTFAAEGGNWLRWWTTPYDGHPSPAGHELAARALAAHIAARELLHSDRARSLLVTPSPSASANPIR